MNTEQLKALLTARMLKWVSGLLGINAAGSELLTDNVTAAVAWAMQALQSADGIWQIVANIVYMLAFVAVEKPPAVKKPLPPASEPAVSGPSGEL